MFNPLDLIGDALDKIVPDAAERRELKLRLLEAQQRGELLPLQKRYEAIVAEAKSADPFTSRARPSFLYVMYVMILASIPVGIVGVFSPETVTAFTEGFKAWFEAIPEELYTLFGIGYLGYAGARSFDKAKIGKK